MGLVLKLVPPRRTSGHGRSKGLPDRLMGYVIECLVEAYILVGAGGRLTTARPDSDVDHKDFIVDERGGYRSIYLQVKGASVLDHGTVSVVVRSKVGRLEGGPNLKSTQLHLAIAYWKLSEVSASPNGRVPRRWQPRRGGSGGQLAQ